jgi:hypothetical protein
LRAAHAVIGRGGTLHLRHGSARNKRETECGDAYDNLSHLRGEKIDWLAKTRVRYAITRRGLSQYSHGRTLSGHSLIAAKCLETSLRDGREIRVRR